MIMSGGEEKRLGTALRKEKKDTDTEDAGCCGDEATLGETVSLASIRDAINETMAKAMSELKNNISDQLSDFQSSVQEDIKKQLAEMRADINLKMEETASEIEATSRRLEEAERRVGEVETFGVEVDAVSTQVQEIQLELKSKLTELEGQSRHNNIRIGGIKEGTSMESQAAHRQILMEFLKEARRNKREQLEQLQKELNFLEEDIKRVEEMSGLYSPIMEAECTVPNVEAPSPAPSCSSIIDPPDYNQPPGFGGTTQGKRQTWYNSTLASRRKRLTAHFEDLEQCYFSNKMSRITEEGRNLNQLDDFMECLSKFTRYNSVRPLATLSYASDLYNGSSIVSSIEFDRDCDYFAIAGVTKKIKVFEYGTVIQDAVDIHYPVNEMTCNSKISCISWSSYHKNLLASSDYEGTVILWDGFTGQRSKVYQEHEKRCWSVDFNLMDPKLLASGSDDAKVKLWSTNLDNSVASIEAKANVCCVKFSPTSRYHLAFGCADHCVHYYDLRNTKQPIMVFKGHRKAVSYAKFVNGEEIVSASTDSQLKLWNVNKPHCLRSFKGHINEKNFVGLASNGDYVACGSENNSLYLYYKGLSKTLLTFKFDTVKSVLDKDKKEDDTNEFVSAVCWRALPDGESNVLIAANSQGTIKVLELV
ncbi:E3 ubiquitin-protein ligase COP1 isoform X2 [Sparus aurata]|uniref:E3 ubiquitin-protein ligase COP1 isoform X2 n=1 Tax=Sparus aurata TaxID=8175 RepID=UPI0011C16AC5|nr:E3 ubiquitin-protein ligase COP1 isoform X2 [Sparus aurata]